MEGPDRPSQLNKGLQTKELSHSTLIHPKLSAVKETHLKNSSELSFWYTVILSSSTLRQDTQQECVIICNKRHIQERIHIS